MTDRPIIFSAPMVRALLDGRKTQTRLVLKPDPDTLPQGVRFVARRLFAAPGDRLWVREAWRSASCYDDLAPSAMSGEEPVRYEEDALWQTWGWGAPLRSHGRLRQGIHMPRWASRLTLTVTDVRVQRLQEISEDDAVAEGIVWSEPTDEDRQWARNYAEEHGGDADIGGVWLAPGTRQGYGMTKEQRAQPQWGPTAAFAFSRLWNSLHGPEAWDANPWVCAVSFTVRNGNIDDAEKEATP